MDGWRHEVLGLIVRMSAAHPTLVRQLAVAVDKQEPASDDEVDEALADLRLLLARVGAEGIKLTQAGYLPPKVVKELFAGMRPEGPVRLYPFPPTTEVNTPPVKRLREAAMALGLVRKYKAALVLTPKGRQMEANPKLLWPSIVEAVPLGKRDFELDAGLVEILGAAAGLRHWEDRELLGGLFAASGWRADGPLSAAHREAADSTRTLLQLLGGGAGMAVRLIRGA